MEYEDLIEVLLCMGHTVDGAREVLSVIENAVAEALQYQGRAARFRADAFYAECKTFAVGADVPLPADTIRKIQRNPYCAWLVLLAAVSWLVYFVGPALISKARPADQAALTDWYNLAPSIAVALTGYLISQWCKSK